MNASSSATAGSGGGWMWCRRLWAASFVFFLVKGLLWLAVPALLYLVQ